MMWIKRPEFTLLVVLIVQQSSGNSAVGPGNWYSRYSEAHAAGYIVHGMRRYRIRFQGTQHYSEDPTVCMNVDVSATYTNGTVSRLDYFVCPYDDNDDYNDIYCCGPEQMQTCCSYWESSKKVEGIVGITMGCLGVILIIGFCFICKYVYSKRKKDERAATAVYQPSSDEKPEGYVNATAPQSCPAVQPDAPA